jgi:hypothetical protein
MLNCVAGGLHHKVLGLAIFEVFIGVDDESSNLEWCAMTTGK